MCCLEVASTLLPTSDKVSKGCWPGREYRKNTSFGHTCPFATRLHSFILSSVPPGAAQQRFQQTQPGPKSLHWSAEHSLPLAFCTALLYLLPKHSVWAKPLLKADTVTPHQGWKPRGCILPVGWCPPTSNAVGTTTKNHPPPQHEAGTDPTEVYLGELNTCALTQST